MANTEPATLALSTLAPSESRPPQTPRGVVDAKTYHEEGVDPETGLVRMQAPTSAKLSRAGKDRICELIVAGHKDQEVSDILVREGHVLSYTAKAVRWWRRQDAVQTALADRTSQAFQSGLGSRASRVSEMSKITTALIAHNFRSDGNGGYRFIESEEVGARQAQAAMVGQIRENIKQIGTLVGDNDPVILKVEGSVKHSVEAQRLGLSDKSDEDVLAMLSRAAARMEEDRRLAAAQDTPGPDPEDAIEGDFEVSA